MAIAVYPIPKIPSKENGARADKLFKRHNGSNVVAVMERSVVDRDKLSPAVENSAWNVSPRIMEYVIVASKVIAIHDAAGIMPVLLPTDFSQASR